MHILVKHHKKVSLQESVVATNSCLDLHAITRSVREFNSIHIASTFYKLARCEVLC